MKKLATALFLIATISTPAFASGQAEQAANYIDKVGKETLSILANESTSKAAKLQKLEIIFRNNVDFKWVGRFVLGRYWRQIDQNQQKRYLSAYQDFLIKHYTARFTDYTSGSFDITGKNALEDNDYLVNMEIKSDDAGEPPIMIDYKVRKHGAQFKIFDIVVEGVSLINTQRSEFGAVMGQKGIEELITMLEDKSASVATAK